MQIYAKQMRNLENNRNPGHAKSIQTDLLSQNRILVISYSKS